MIAKDQENLHKQKNQELENQIKELEKDRNKNLEQISKINRIKKLVEKNLKECCDLNSL